MLPLTKGTPELLQIRAFLLELHKRIPCTTHFTHGRPTWPILDRPTKQFVRVVVKNENPHMRLYHVLEWAALMNEGLMSLCY
ncbi:hypothetical protein B5X24_HaOG207441 [Helicoverpa armigera]|nr:hypothetical protein B5X24_HaOG207441 [Helicoverpa armigera]